MASQNVPNPPKLKKESIFVKVFFFLHFLVILAYVFLSGKSADPTPPLLVENSTNFFFETFPY